MSSAQSNELSLINPPQQPSDEGSSSRIPQQSWFIGVVPQQNDCRGAEIFFNNSLKSLGTFQTEVDATRAYDIAAAKVHGNDFFRNFLLTNDTILEPCFHSFHSVDDIGVMITDGSYESKLKNFIANHPCDYDYGVAVQFPSCLETIKGVYFRVMFHKVMTLSDLQMEDGLILPEQALSYFSPSRSKVDFKDKTNHPWDFQYVYWPPSRRHIFTGGWRKFVQEMKLCANDIVVFYRCWDIRTSRDEFYDIVDIIRLARPSG